MNYDYDFAVFIGRFQPPHAGHLHVIQQGLTKAQRVIVLVGSAWQPRNPRNPWTHAEREQMIRTCVPEKDQERLQFAPLMDSPYNDETWTSNVQTTVAGFVTAHHAVPHRKPRIALIGHAKDQTGYYLSLFPQWESISVENYQGLSATPLREGFFAAGEQVADFLKRLAANEAIPERIVEQLTRFAETNGDYKALCDEMEFVAKYREAWSAAPYPPTFVTVDAVVVQSGHVLLVERRARPGKGLLALPGGFVNQGERLLDACLRELREETKLKVPPPVLKGSIKATKVFDDPYRSARGRTITHAFYIELERQRTLPKVKGGDDAQDAKWVALGELDPQTMFEDHYFIIQDLIGAA